MMLWTVNLRILGRIVKLGEYPAERALGSHAPLLFDGVVPGEITYRFDWSSRRTYRLIAGVIADRIRRRLGFK